MCDKVKALFCVEPSTAISVAKNKLKEKKNIFFLQEKIQNCSIEDSSLDFAYSLGVLHHIENTEDCLKIINNKLKTGSPFLLYVYYNFENRSVLFRLIWKVSNIFRVIISQLPFKIKLVVSFFLSLFIYLPLSFFSKTLYYFKIDTNNIPLSYYKNKSFYTMQTDALDRFGTKLEKRYSKKDIKEILINSGFTNIIFSNNMPFWCISCYKL